MLLLHGWVASGGLNWMRAFDVLAPHYRVLAPDLRGHANAEPCRTHFSIQDCADDMGALLERLSPDRPAIVVGYSMGGMVAQELWRRHPDRVGGLVLSATSCSPVPVSRGRDTFTQAMSAARATLREVSKGLNAPLRVSSRLETSLPRAFAKRFQTKWLRRLEEELWAEDVERAAEPAPGPFGNAAADPSGSARRRRVEQMRGWARKDFARHHWPSILDAGRAIAAFDTRSWIRDVDVPTLVMMTKRDRLVPRQQQQEMARRIPGARIEAVDAGHFACVRRDFGPRVLRSVRLVEKGIA